MSMEEKQNSQTFQDFNQNIFKPNSREEITQIVKNCYKKNIPLEINGFTDKVNISKNDLYMFYPYFIRTETYISSTTVK